MDLTTAQVDRACGVLLGAACGDALGAGYEFATVPPDFTPAMIGGGLGDFAPGEWTDDTAQAVAIAEATAAGHDLRTSAGLDAVAQRLADWYAGGPADVGIQTAAVLRKAGRTPTAETMRTAAREVHEQSGRSAGNGSLMRTGIVAVAHLDDPEALVEAAMAVAALTHFDEVGGQACALWCLMIRHAVLTGELPTFDDVAPWVPDAETWRGLLAEAEASPPSAFTANAWVVGALQAAWAAIVHTPMSDGPGTCGHLLAALDTAIGIGHDTDTVAAIAGALLGARWGASAVPAAHRRMLHGWPGRTAFDLERLAYLTVRGGEPGHYGWPAAERIDYTHHQYGAPALARHPLDDGVYLAGATALDAIPADVDAVVSLCLTGRRQVDERIEQVTFRLIDDADPTENPHLDFVLADAAHTVAQLRDEGKRVLLHCVAANSRTPTVGILYAMLRGADREAATAAVCGALPAARPNSGFVAALARIEGTL